MKYLYTNASMQATPFVIFWDQTIIRTFAIDSILDSSLLSYKTSQIKIGKP